MLLAQPLIEWAMVSASGSRIALGSFHMFPIAPFNLTLFAVLREAHSVVAYLFVLFIALHVSMILLHTITLRDGMLRRMTFRRSRRRTAPPAHIGRDGQ